MIKSQYELMAQYNALMNGKILDSLCSVSNEILWKDKSAFFGSILGTLNHILVGDLIWLKRFNQHPNYQEGLVSLAQLNDFPVPTSLNQVLYRSFDDYREKRQLLDNIIIRFIEETTQADYGVGLTYQNTKGEFFTKPFALLAQHLFNHQTHHRGQVTTLLNQINIDIGETDLLMLIRNE